MTGTNFRIAPDVTSRRLGGDMVLVHLGTNEIFRLNETGARLLELLAEDADLSAAERALAAEYEVAPATLHEEVRATVARLEAERVLLRDPR